MTPNENHLPINLVCVYAGPWMIVAVRWWLLLFVVYIGDRRSLTAEAVNQNKMTTPQPRTVRLTLVRHGETVGNRQGIVVGQESSVRQ